MKRFLLPFFCLLASIAFLFLHNLVSAIFMIEEPVFFTLTFVFGLIFLASFVYQFTKKIIITAIIVGFLALDWAALDDITTGNEPQLWGEYAILIFSLIFFGLLLLNKQNLW